MYFHRDINPTVSKVINEALSLPASKETAAGHTQSLKPSGQPGGMQSDDEDMADKGNKLRSVPGPLGKRARHQKKKADASPAVNEADHNNKVCDGCGAQFNCRCPGPHDVVHIDSCSECPANEAKVNPNGTTVQPEQVSEMKIVPSDSVRNGYYVVDGETRISGIFIGKDGAQAELGRLTEATDEDKDKKKKKYKKSKQIDRVLLGR